MKYDENVRCPECGNSLQLRLFQKGFRFRCEKCKFKVYPPLDQISEELLMRYLRESVQPALAEAQSRFDKWRSSLRREANPEPKE